MGPALLEPSTVVSSAAHGVPTELFALVGPDLAAVEARLRAMAAVPTGALRELLSSVLGARGKLLRPALTVACGRLFREPSASLYAMAAAVECLHSATLIHDDIIDETSARRGGPTLHSTAGSAAILAGDYLFAQAAAVASETNNLRIMRLFAECVMQVCAGQIEEHGRGSPGQPWLTREGYYRTIDAKTGALFVLACHSGAVLGEASLSAADALRRYGRTIGLAFQIVDDILDLVGDQALLGKPVGSDLRQGVVTLPVIYLRDELPESLLCAAFGEDGAQESAIGEVTARARESRAIQRAHDEAREHARSAAQLLVDLPRSPYRDLLDQVAMSVVEREL